MNTQLAFGGLPTPTTDLELAEENLLTAIAAWTKANDALVERYPNGMTFPGRRTSEWDAYIDTLNAEQHPAYTILNLMELLYHEDDSYTRRISFDNHTHELRIDGDWLNDLDGASNEMCISCAKKMLLAGEVSYTQLFAYLLYVDQPENSVNCSECNVELWHVGQRCSECNAIVLDDEVQDWDNVLCPACIEADAEGRRLGEDESDQRLLARDSDDFCTDEELAEDVDTTPCTPDWKDTP